MTTLIGASVFVDPSQIRHDVVNGNPTITFGPWPTVNRVDVHLGDVATIDKVIAALVALKQEMDPPVVGCDCMADAPAPSGIWAAQDFTPGDGGVLLPAGCDPDTAPVPGLTPKGHAALDNAALVPAAPRVIRSAALPGGAA